MKKIVFTVLFLSSAAFAKGTEGVLEFTNAKVFAPLKGTNATAGYGTIKNTTAQEVVLKLTKAEPFKAVETHQTKEKAGKMAMEKVESFKIPAQGSLELKPGGNHIMLFDPSREVKTGEQITVQFLVDGKPVEAKFKVEARVEGADSHAGHP